MCSFGFCLKGNNATTGEMCVCACMCIYVYIKFSHWAHVSREPNCRFLSGGIEFAKKIKAIWFSIWLNAFLGGRECVTSRVYMFVEHWLLPNLFLMCLWMICFWYQVNPIDCKYHVSFLCLQKCLRYGHFTEEGLI